MTTNPTHSDLAKRGLLTAVLVVDVALHKGRGIWQHAAAYGAFLAESRTAR